MLEITISDSEKLLLKRAGFENVISFCLLLGYGNIKNINNLDKREIENVSFSPKDQLSKLEKNKDNQVRIWYASCDNEDLCTLYYLVSVLSKKNIEIFVCDVADEYHFSVGTYSEQEIPSLISKTKKLTDAEQKDYIEIWEHLTEENNDLRIIENKILKSVPFEYLDSKIITILNKYEKIKYWSLIGECMKESLCGIHSDIFYRARINELINQNKIEVCEIKKEKNILGEIKEQKYIRINKNI